MRVLVAPDKFKGSLKAAEAAEAIAEGLGTAFEAKCMPIADGGDGTAGVLCEAMGGEWREVNVHDALGREVTAGFGLAISNGRRLALLEMSEASGLARLAESERDPWRASTEGTGELIRAAMNAGAEKIIVGIGGSATNDGGTGMAQALGFRFIDGDGHRLERLPEQLADVESIVRATEAIPEIVVACDVENPLLGEQGATRVYGPQKGVLDEEMEKHEERLAHLADLVERDLGVDYRDEPGAGAAGGLGFGLLSFCGAELQSGFELVADLVGLRDAIAAADLVITGEGSLDAQTLMGKGPGGVAKMARELGRPVVAFCGRATDRDALDQIFDGVFAISGPRVSEADAMARAEELLKKTVAEQVDFLQGFRPAN